MPDISMCRDHACPSRGQCYRYMATPSERQTYAEFWRAEGMSNYPSRVIDKTSPASFGFVATALPLWTDGTPFQSE